MFRREISDRQISDRETQAPSYPAVQMVLGAIAGWVDKYRRAIADHDEFARCDTGEVTRIAGELGVAPDELRAMAGKGPHGADLLRKLLTALRVDSDEIAKANPGVMRDLQRLCVSCADKKRCAHELAAGTAAGHFHEYCPNSYTLDALFKEKTGTALH